MDKYEEAIADGKLPILWYEWVSIIISAVISLVLILVYLYFLFMGVSIHWLLLFVGVSLYTSGSIYFRNRKLLPIPNSRSIDEKKSIIDKLQEKVNENDYSTVGYKFEGDNYCKFGYKPFLLGVTTNVTILYSSTGYYINCTDYQSPFTDFGYNSNRLKEIIQRLKDLNE